MNREIIERTCKYCNKKFNYVYVGGRIRKFCSKECKQLYDANEVWNKRQSIAITGYDSKGNKQMLTNQQLEILTGKGTTNTGKSKGSNYSTDQWQKDIDSLSNKELVAKYKALDDSKFTKQTNEAQLQANEWTIDEYQEYELSGQQYEMNDKGKWVKVEEEKTKKDVRREDERYSAYKDWKY